MGKSPQNAVARDGDAKSTADLQTSADITSTSNAKNESPHLEPAAADSLGPPPRPAAAATQPVSNAPDYFSVNHSAITAETNPFEASFAFGHNGDGQTPGGTKLPSVAALTSPAGLLGGGGVTPSFWSSLRSGPLSPAMLSGPNRNEDYFGDRPSLRGGFPTPNESSLRSGLTPGGGGSMFPEPSPSTLFSLGGATPGSLDFHRAAMSAAAQKRDLPQGQLNITSQPQDHTNGMDAKPPTSQFDQHDANDAANGLFLLAQAHSGPQQTTHYAMAPQMPVHHAHPAPNLQMGNQSTKPSPPMDGRHQQNGSMSTASGRGASEMSEDNEPQPKPNTRGKGKAKASRRKADETPTKGPPSKKAKANNGHFMPPEPESEEELDYSKEEEFNANGKKMTDEEKRKNFLERNRVAALKCRQRKKQWLANLQQKVEIFSTENDQLSQQISILRDEILNLKTILVAHKECPVTQQQGLAGLPMQHLMEGGFPHQANPYGMAQPGMGGSQIMANGQGLQDRQF